MISSRTRTRALGARLWILIGLLLGLPVISFTLLELARLDEQETLLQELYRAQLGTILFSVNQYCWDVVNGWGNTLRAELATSTDFSLERAEPGLVQVQQRYAPLLAAFAFEAKHITLALTDSLQPQRESIAARMVSKLEENAVALERMREHSRKGYLRPEAFVFGEIGTEREALLFVFAGEQNVLQGFLLSPQKFAREILQPKIAEFAAKEFVLAVLLAQERAVLIATQEQEREAFEYEEPLWIFPNMTLAIKQRGTSTAQLVAARTRRTLFLLLGIDALVLLTLAVLLRVLVRESRLTRLKSNFVDNVSHDLRTPLGLIRMYAETLQMERVPSEEKKKEYYAVLARESERLTRMVNNLLDFSRIEAGRKVYEPKAVNLAEIVGEVLKSYRYHLQQRGFTLDEKISPDMPLIKADAEAVSQAFVNLLDNAVKYSEEHKHVAVAVYCEKEYVVVEVADRGLGIAAKDQQKIFDKFYRVETVGRETRGAGMGLALVQHIMSGHHGKVEVRSELGKGSSFSLKFPQEKV